MGNPRLLDFILKHPSMLQNLNEDNVKFLRRNFMRSQRNPKPTQEEATSQQARSATGRAIILSNLPIEATEADVNLLLTKAGLAPVEVNLARESRYRRSCGVAYAVLASKQAAKEAVVKMQTYTINGHVIRVECPGGASAQERGGRRIVWKDDEELWDVAIFDKFESVLTFGEKCRNNATPAPAPQQEASASQVGPAAAPASEAAMAAESQARFREAQARERAEEARRVREALTATGAGSGGSGGQQQLPPGG